MQKACTTCKLIWPLSRFSPDKRNKTGVYASCKKCCSERARATRCIDPSASILACRKWRENNQANVKAYRKDYYAKNSSVLKEAAKRSYWGNVESNRKRMVEAARRNRQQRRAYEATRRAENPDMNRVKLARRRAMCINAPGRGISSVDVAMLIESQRNQCAVCRVSLSAGYHVDHITPLVSGGEHDKVNAQILCVTCNTSKGAKHSVDFMQSRGFLC